MSAVNVSEPSTRGRIRYRPGRIRRERPQVPLGSFKEGRDFDSIDIAFGDAGHTPIPFCRRPESPAPSVRTSTLSVCKPAILRRQLLQYVRGAQGRWDGRLYESTPDLLRAYAQWQKLNLHEELKPTRMGVTHWLYAELRRLGKLTRRAVADCDQVSNSQHGFHRCPDT